MRCWPDSGAVTLFQRRLYTSCAACGVLVWTLFRRAEVKFVSPVTSADMRGRRCVVIDARIEEVAEARIRSEGERKGGEGEGGEREEGEREEGERVSGRKGGGRGRRTRNGVKSRK